MPKRDRDREPTRDELVAVRLPQDLADQVKQYASRHRITLSELLRDGLAMRLEVDVPGRSPWREEPDDAREPIHPAVEKRLRQIIREELAREMAAVRRLAAGLAPEPRLE